MCTYIYIYIYIHTYIHTYIYTYTHLGGLLDDGHGGLVVGDLGLSLRRGLLHKVHDLGDLLRKKKQIL